MKTVMLYQVVIEYLNSLRYVTSLTAYQNNVAQLRGSNQVVEKSICSSTVLVGRQEGGQVPESLRNSPWKKWNGSWGKKIWITVEAA